MKPYIPNPKLFRDHFAGQGLPSFQGQRMQRGYGGWKSKVKRYAVPLLAAGLRAAVPHLSNAARHVTSAAMQRFAPNSSALQQSLGSAAGKLTGKALGVATRRLPSNKVMDQFVDGASTLALQRRNAKQKKRLSSDKLIRGVKKARTTSNIFA